MRRPEPINEEIALDPKRYIVSETDAKGTITYCNDYFVQVSGYSREEMLGKKHHIIRHPDMPKILIKLMSQRVKNGQNINAVIKNMAKDGRNYWVFTEFATRKDLDTHEVIGYTASRKAASKHVVEVVSSLYAKLLEIEKNQGVAASEVYLNRFLKEKGEDIEFHSLMEKIHKFY